MEHWTKQQLEEFVDEQWEDAAESVMLLINKWLERGDGVAVYRNADLGSNTVGEPRIVSYGSAAAQLEVQEPPQRLPDGIPADAINWRFQLEAVCREISPEAKEILHVKEEQGIEAAREKTAQTIRDMLS